jgi:KDO2-lipid IV(A) lauroyltransferase
LWVVLARALPEPWVMAFVRWVGRVAYRISPRAEDSRDNARHVLGPDASAEEVSRVARDMFQKRALGYYDLARLPFKPAEYFEQRLTLIGVEYLEQVLREKRGAVLTSAHKGPVEFMVQAIALMGYPVVGVMEHLSPERYHQYLINLRRAHGLELVSTRSSMLDIFRRVKQGEVLVSALDRDSTDTGCIIDFLGAPAWMPDGYARVAVQANAPLLVGFIHETDDGGVIARFNPPLYPDRSLGKEQAVLDLMRRALQFFEQALQVQPEEWHMSTPVWRVAQERLQEDASR